MVLKKVLLSALSSRQKSTSFHLSERLPLWTKHDGCLDTPTFCLSSYFCLTLSIEHENAPIEPTVCEILKASIEWFFSPSQSVVQCNIQYNFIAKCQHNYTRNVLWWQVHSSHIHSNHKTLLNYSNSKQTISKNAIELFPFAVSKGHIFPFAVSRGHRFPFAVTEGIFSPLQSLRASFPIDSQ